MAAYRERAEKSGAHWFMGFLKLPRAHLNEGSGKLLV